MIQPYTSSTKLARSLLVHAGSFQTNQTDASVLPGEFAGLTDTQQIPFNIPNLGTYPNPPPFTHFDAGVMQASNYDELIIDIQPIVTYNPVGSVTNISTTASTTDYNQIAATGKPYWIIIRIGGYGITQLQTRDLALATSLSVMGVIWNDLLSFNIAQNFRGFAFTNPDLNVQFPDLTVVDRLFQNTLVGACWAINRAACIVTTRPGDALTMVGPTLTANANSGAALVNPIIGCNVAQRDKIVMYYPNYQPQGQNLSVVVGQVVAAFAKTNRDPGFTPNLDLGYAIPVNDSYWTADGTIGLTANTSIIEVNLNNMMIFIAAMGITSMGLFTNASTGVNIPAPFVFLPTNDQVNTTGQCAVWGADGFTYVNYAAAAGATPSTVTRQFNTSFVESQYTANPAA